MADNCYLFSKFVLRNRSIYYNEIWQVYAQAQSESHLQKKMIFYIQRGGLRKIKI